MKLKYKRKRNARTVCVRYSFKEKSVNKTKTSDMSDYSNEQFEASQDDGNGASGDQTFKLKLSVDVRGAKNF